jgi:hypothetical protein
MDESLLDGQSSEDQDTVRLLDRLLETVDGGRSIVVRQYEASIILALLGGHAFGDRMMRAAEELQG